MFACLIPLTDTHCFLPRKITENVEVSLNLKCTCEDFRHLEKLQFSNGCCEGVSQTSGKFDSLKEGVFNRLLKQNSIVQVLGTSLLLSDP